MYGRLSTSFLRRPSSSDGGRRSDSTEDRASRRSPSRARQALAASLLSIATLTSRTPAQTSLNQPASASQPASAGVRPFQPGVSIDWSQRAVVVDGHVVLREGPIEFFACFAGKEHESIVRFDAAATHIYMALGLIGLESGHPPRWDDQRGRFDPPAGDLVDVTIEWDCDGRRQSAAAFEWMRTFEFGRPPLNRPWVFAGSRRLPDATISADRSGEGLAVVDKPDCLFALSRTHVSRDADLWAEANTPAIAPLDSPVWIVLHPAEPRSYSMRVDHRGAAFVDGRFAHPEDVADLIMLARQLSPQYVQHILLVETLRSDVADLTDRLEAAGVPANAVRFERADPKSPSAGNAND